MLRQEEAGRFLEPSRREQLEESGSSKIRLHNYRDKTGRADPRLRYLGGTDVLRGLGSSPNYLSLCNHIQGLLCPRDEERGEVAKPCNGRHGNALPACCSEMPRTEER